MAWTAPMTAVANAVFTAAQFNTHVRDNFLETSPAKATTQGSYFVTNSANSIIERMIEVAENTSDTGTTSSTSYTTTLTSGGTNPVVTADTGIQALVILSAGLGNDTASDYAAMSIAVSGATTIAASDTNALIYRAPASISNRLQVSNAFVMTLNSGTNVFTPNYRSITGGSSAFERRRITVIPF